MVSVCDSGVEGDSLSSSTLSNTLIGQSVASNSDDQAISETLSDTSDDQTTLGEISRSSSKMPSQDPRRRSITVSKLAAQTPALRDSVISSRLASTRHILNGHSARDATSSSSSRSASNSSVNTQKLSQRTVTTRLSSRLAPDSSRIPSKVASITSKCPASAPSKEKSVVDSKSRCRVLPLSTTDKSKKPPEPSKTAPVQVAAIKKKACPPAPTRPVVSRAALVKPVATNRPSDLPSTGRYNLRSAASSKNTLASSAAVSTPDTVASIPLKSSSTASVSSQNSKKSNSTVSSLSRSGKTPNNVVAASRTTCKLNNIPSKKSTCPNSNAGICDTRTISGSSSLVRNSVTVTKLKQASKAVSTAASTLSSRQVSAPVKAQKDPDTSSKLVESYKNQIEINRANLTHSQNVIDALAITVRYLNENLDAFETPGLRAQLRIALDHVSNLEQSLSSKDTELNNIKEQMVSREKFLSGEIENLKDEIERGKIRHSEEREMILQQYSRGESAHKKYRINLQRDWESKTKGLNDRIKTLECEVSSLQSVLELKQDKIKSNEVRILELELACEELPSTKSAIVALRQKMEEIESIVANKNLQIKTLLEENQRLQALNEKSVKEKKRLSMRNEELEFVLNESRSGNISADTSVIE